MICLLRCGIWKVLRIGCNIVPFPGIIVPLLQFDIMCRVSLIPGFKVGIEIVCWDKFIFAKYKVDIETWCTSNLIDNEFFPVISMRRPDIARAD